MTALSEFLPPFIFGWLIGIVVMIALTYALHDVSYRLWLRKFKKEHRRDSRRTN